MLDEEGRLILVEMTWIEFYRRILKLKKKIDEIEDGEIETLLVRKDYDTQLLYVFFRELQTQTVLCAHALRTLLMKKDRETEVSALLKEFSETDTSKRKDLTMEEYNNYAMDLREQFYDIDQQSMRSLCLDNPTTQSKRIFQHYCIMENLTLDIKNQTKTLFTQSALKSAVENVRNRESNKVAETLK